jgi:PAS domain S-box-containing protein
VSTSPKVDKLAPTEGEARLAGPVVVFQWRAEEGWPVEYVSSNVEEVFGYSASEFLGGDLLYIDIIHPDDRSRLAEECEAFVEAAATASAHSHYRVVRADGEVVYVDEANRIVRDDDGQPTHYVGHVVDVTERRQAAVQLRQRKDTLAEALEIAQLGYWEWDLRVDDVYWSDELYNMLGVEPGAVEPCWDSFREFVHPDDIEKIDHIVEATVERQNPYNIVHRIRRRSDGQLRYLRGRGKLIEDHAGRPARLIGTIQDITETVRAEEILRNERSWLHSLIQAMPDGISFRDGEGRWLLANDYTLEYLGLTGVDYQGKTAEELAEFSDNYRVAQWDCRRTDSLAWDSGEPYAFEQEVPSESGELHTFDVIKVPVYESDHSRKGLLVVARDITDRKRTARQLEESRARLAQAQRIAHLGGWELDLDSGHVTWSDEVYRIFGHEPGERTIDLDYVLSRLPEPDRERVERATKRTQRTGQPFQLEHAIETESGQRRIVSSQGKLEHDEDDQPRRMVGIIQDITERKHVEQLKEEFVSIVSHELRTPLTPITGVLTLLAGGGDVDLPPRIRKMVELALRNSHRLLYLIDDLLDIQKMSSGQMDFNIRRLDLSEVVGESLRINVGLEHRNAVKFVFEESCAECTVRGDKGRLIQVMTNLLSNAAKFSPANSIVDIRLERVDDSVARVLVTDNGPGIAEEFRPRVFERFAQADSSSTRKHGGTGLGLTISKSIVERLGGEIGFETEVDQGATFYFDLPLADEL